MRTSANFADRPCPICHAKHPHHADEKRTVHVCPDHEGRHLHEVEPGRWRLFDHHPKGTTRREAA